MTKRKQTHIFATRSDLESNLKLIDAEMRLKYLALTEYSIGDAGKPIVVPHKSPEFEEFESLLRDNSLGLNVTGDHITGQNYLIVDAHTEVKFESALQNKGGIHYFVNQLLNPTSITFSPGGLYEDRCLICGHIGTISEHPQSLELYRAFTRAVTKGFKKIGSYKVGPEALQLMKAGTRMITMGIDEPPEYDLRA